MPGKYQYDIELKSNVAKLLTDMKEVQDRLDTVEGKEYKIKLNVDEKKLSNVISNLEKMLGYLGKGTGDFKQFENLSKQLSSITTDINNISKAFSVMNDGSDFANSIKSIDTSLTALSNHFVSEMSGRMTSSIKEVKSTLSDIGDGGELAPLLQTINKIENAINELSTSVKGIGLNMNIDVGSDSEMEAKVQSKIVNALQAYQRLFDHIKMSSAGGQIITDKFFDFDINQYDTMMGKLQAYKKFIDNMRKEAKAQFNGQDVLYQDTEKGYWTQASAAMGQVTKAFNEMKSASDTNPLKDLFGSGDLSEVVSQLGLIVAKLEEISTTASSFKNVFANGFNITASVEEIDKLTNRVKELEDELVKIKLNPVNVDKSNISSGNKIKDNTNSIQKQNDALKELILSWMEAQKIMTKSGSQKIEKLAVGNIDTGYASNANVTGDLNEISSKLINNVINAAEEKINTMIHSHPGSNVAAFSPEDIQSAIINYVKGLENQIVVGMNEVSIMNVSKLKDVNPIGIAQKVQLGIDNLIDSYVKNKLQTINGFQNALNNKFGYDANIWEDLTDLLSERSNSDLLSNIIQKYKSEIVDSLTYFASDKTFNTSNELCDLIYDGVIKKYINKYIKEINPDINQSDFDALHQKMSESFKTTFSDMYEKILSIDDYKGLVKGDDFQSVVKEAFSNFLKTIGIKYEDVIKTISLDKLQSPDFQIKDVLSNISSETQNKQLLEGEEIRKNLYQINSEIGLSEEEFIQKLRQENEEVKNGNRQFQERLALLKDGKVVASYFGDKASMNIHNSDLVDSFDKVIHSHSPIEGSSVPSFEDLDLIFGKYKSEIKDFVLFYNNEIRSLQAPGDMSLLGSEFRDYGKFLDAISSLTSNSSIYSNYANNYLASIAEEAGVAYKQIDALGNEINSQRINTSDWEIILETMRQLTNMHRSQNQDAEFSQIAERGKQLSNTFIQSNESAEKFEITVENLFNVLSSLWNKIESNPLKTNAFQTLRDELPSLSKDDINTVLYGDEMFYDANGDANELKQVAQKIYDNYYLPLINGAKELQNVSSEIPIKDVFQGDDKVNTDASTTAIKEESQALEQVSTSAKDAANAKEKFADANKEVKASAESSSTSLDEEKKKIENVGDSAEETKKKLDDVVFKPNTEGFDEIVSKLDIAKDKIEEISKITKSSVWSESQGEYLESYNIKYKNGTSEIRGESSNKKGSNVLRASEVAYDAKAEEQAAKKLQSQKNAFHKKNLTAIDLEIQKREEEAKSFSSSLKAQMEERQKDISSMESSLKSFNESFKQLSAKPDDQHQFSSWKKQLEDLNIKIAEYKSKVENLSKIDIADETQINKAKTEIEDLGNSIKDTITSMKNIPQASRGWNQASVDKLIQRMNDDLKKNSKYTDETKQKIQGLIDELNNIPDRPLLEVFNDFSRFKREAHDAGKEGKAFFEIFKEKVIYGGAAQLAGMFGFYDIINIFRDGIDTLKEFDDGLTKISYTMDMTKSQLNDLGKSVLDTANDIDSSIDNAMQVSQIYANMNTSAEEIKKLSEPTLILSNLTGFDASTVADDIQAVTQQFDIAAESSMHIADVYDQISRNISVDYSKGIESIAEAVQVAGSTADQAGLSFEQLAAIVGKTVEKTRLEGSQVGNGLKTIMTRLSKVGKLSEEVDNETLSQASESLKKVGIEVYNLDGSYREFDVIMGELAGKWDSLTDAEKSNISFNIAATRQTNLLSAVLSNFSDSMQLAEEATNANGNALENNQKWVDSFGGHLQSLENTAKSAWINILDSETIKGGVDVLNSLLKVVVGLVDTFGLLPTAAGIGGIVAGIKNVGINTLVAY